MEQTPRKGSWQIWVGMLVGVACLAAVFIFFAEPGEIIASLRHVHFGYLLLGAAGVVLFLVVRAVRWRFMLANAAPYAPIFHIQNIGSVSYTHLDVYKRQPCNLWILFPGPG